VRSLPRQPSLEQLRKQAKDLRRAHQRGDPACCPTLRWIKRLSGLDDKQLLEADVSLNEAQRALAMDYGFADWPAMHRFVTGARDRGPVNVPGPVVAQWQSALDVLATIAAIPAALIMRAHAAEIEVFVTSRSDDNPYQAGQREPRSGSGLYCEYVLTERARLCVPHALSDPCWCQNPDIEQGMVAYLGLPLRHPDGELFGTICVLDNKKHRWGEDVDQLLRCFRGMVEAHLELLDVNQELGGRVQQLTGTLEQLRATRSVVAVCSWCLRLRDADGKWSNLNGRAEHPKGPRITHGICPDCYDMVTEDSEAP